MPESPKVEDRDTAAPVRRAGGSDRSGILTPGRNCWRVERASRTAFLVDGAAYFDALRAALLRAQHSVFIVGWDVDSRLRLTRAPAQDEFPEELGPLLNALVERRRSLEVYVLAWDFAMLYAFDREWPPMHRLDWRGHRRVHFRLDDCHPVGASHHQKIVVIDDAVAFVGGLDLAARRWDTPAHSPGDARRSVPSGERYAPFHDIQMLVEGEAAQALGDLVRERWRRATGSRPAPRRTAESATPWPPDVVPDLPDVRVGIARTEPAWEGREGVQEIKELYLEAVHAARNGIYIENQYFSATAVGEALGKRLEERGGPDIVLVLRRENAGWLEATTVGVLRARLDRRLRAADREDRYRLYYPRVPDLEPQFVNVHAKLLIVDDELASIGSANLSNRSMGLDTECALVIEAQGQARVRAAIAALRQRLLSEHLGVEPVAVKERVQRCGRLVPAIESLRGGVRTLAPLVTELPAELDALVPDASVVDPEEPFDADVLLSEYVPREAKRSVPHRLLGSAALLAVALGVAAAWRWSALGEWLDIGTLTGLVHNVEGSSLAPVLVLACYVVAGLLVIPLTVLIIVTALVFGPFQALLYSVSGATLSAAVTYAMGRWLGRGAVGRLAGPRARRAGRWFAKRGVLSVVALRVVPVAPFTVVNLIAGAFRLRARDFLVGTALGVLPGTTAIILFTDRVAAAVRAPSPGAFAVLGLALAVIAGAGLAVRRWMRTRDPDRPAVESSRQREKGGATD